MIYDCGFEDASTLIRVLMGDNEFLEFNAKQHNRFRAAFKKYLKMGGQLPAKERKSLSVKKISLPVAKEIEKVQPKDFDKSKFEITLLRRYRNGMQFVLLILRISEKCMMHFLMKLSLLMMKPWKKDCVIVECYIKTDFFQLRE